MPDPFNKAKMTGDTHPPEVESDLPLEEGSASNEPGVSGTPGDRGRAAEIGRAGRSIKKGGLLKDSDDAGGPDREASGNDSGGDGRNA